jgi:uncharacterized membrane-anchored protein
MSAALQLIQGLVIDQLFKAPAPQNGFEKAKTCLSVLSVCFMVAGLVFLIYAAHVWLSAHYSRDIAAAITGLLCVAFSAVLAGIVFAILCYRKARIKAIQRHIPDTIKSLLSTLETELTSPIRENPKTAVIMASILGFLIENQLFEQ